MAMKSTKWVKWPKPHLGQIAISNQPSFHIPTSSVTAYIPNTPISWSTRSVPKLSIQISKPIQVMRTMVVYLLGTSGHPLDSIQPAQENQSMIWASLSLKKSFSIFPSKSSRFAPTHTLQAPISSKSPIRWQRETRSFPSRSPWSPIAPIWAFLASPTSIRKESGDRNQF